MQTGPDLKSFSLPVTHLTGGLTLFTIARYRSTGRSRLAPSNVTSCGFSDAIFYTKAAMSSFSERSPMCGAPIASICQPTGDFSAIRAPMQVGTEVFGRDCIGFSVGTGLDVLV